MSYNNASKLIKGLFKLYSSKLPIKNKFKIIN